MAIRYNQVAQLVGRLEREGWRVERRKKGWMAFPPDLSRPGVPIHLSPSDHRAWKNLLSHLKSGR